MVRILLTILLLLTVSHGWAWDAKWNEDWVRVCRVLGVDPAQVHKPAIQVVSEDYYILKCAGGGEVQGAYFLINHTVFINQKYKHDRATYIHEFAHAVLYSQTYQEMMANRVEQIIIFGDR